MRVNFGLHWRWDASSESFQPERLLANLPSLPDMPEMALAMQNDEKLHTKTRFCWSLLAAAGLLACFGCYNGSAMVSPAQSAAVTSRLAEVDLGKFQTTLPRDPETSRYTALDLHLFGTVARHQLSAASKQIKADEFRLRHEMLTAIRKSTREELAEPNLGQLRSRIEKVVNEILADAPIKEIGFYQLTMRSPG